MIIYRASIFKWSYYIWGRIIVHSKKISYAKLLWLLVFLIAIFFRRIAVRLMLKEILTGMAATNDLW